MVDFANYDALVGVALGAGLTYGFSALNRRHQEAREDMNSTRSLGQFRGLSGHAAAADCAAW
jgi:hypothetical protein